MPEFDPHAVIRKLAEVEWECMACAGTGQQPMLLCQTCGGTGHIVPFVSLRVEKQGIWSHGDCNGVVPCHLQFADGSVPRGTTDCEGRGWIPEPDVRVACWEIAKMRADAVQSRRDAWRLADNIAQDSLLLDTIAWIKEQHD